MAVVAILVSDRRDTFKAEAYGATRGVADTVLTPVGDALSAPGRWTGAGIRAAVAMSGPGDAVLWAGTGRTEYRDIGGRKIPYSFHAEACAALAELQPAAAA